MRTYFKLEGSKILPIIGCIIFSLLLVSPNVHAQEICNNGIDDDGDGFLDCDDPDCYLTNSNECVTCLGDGPSFADEVLEYQPECAAELHPNTNMPDKAIGMPDYQLPLPGDIYGMNFTSLGEGGFIRLAFTDNILVNSGNTDPDLWVFEVGTDIEASDIELRPLNTTTENNLIAVGLTDVDGDGFYYINSIGGATSNLDIDASIPGFVFGELQFDAVKITDVFQNNPCLGSAGADIDAVCALSSMPAEVCENGIDDDGDGLIDCDDPDLANDCCCLAITPVDLGPDFQPCPGSTILLDAGDDFANYLWSDQSMESTLSVTTDGTYSVTTVDFCDNVTEDSILLQFQTTGQGIENFELCEGETIIYNNVEYSQAGTYEQTIGGPTGCDSTVTINIVVNPVFSFVESHTINLGDSIEINGTVYSQQGYFIQNFTTQVGCDSIYNINIIVNHEIIHYDFNDCLAWIDTDNNDYSEFSADYPEPLDCDVTSATVVYRENPLTNLHSCTPGVNNSLSMCVSSLDNCQYDKTSDLAVRFEVTINPSAGFATQISKLSFQQKAPETFDWINGNSGPNNYPTLYGMRILKDGQEIFFADGIPTDTDWRKQEFDFFNNPNLYTTATATFAFELMGYCLVGNGSTVSAWDLDDIKISANCDDLSGTPRYAMGKIVNDQWDPMAGISVRLKGQLDETTITDDQGNYAFWNPFKADYLVATENEYPLNGVSTLDILLIQKHILGIQDLSSSYKMIAADVNQSGSISAIDLIQIRKLILGIYNEFPMCESWRFIPSNQDLVNNPLLCEDFYDLSLIENSLEMDLVGIKMGDIDGNNSWKFTAIESDNRSDESFKLQYNLERNNHFINVPIYTQSENLISGIQLALNLKEITSANILSGTLDIEPQHYNLSAEGVLSISWSDINGVMTSDQPLFTLQFVSENPSALPMTLDQQALSSEAYIGENLETRKVDLVTRENDVASLTEVTVSPNPFRMSTRINMPPHSNGQLSLFDNHGKKINTWNVIDSDRLVLDDSYFTSNGIYYIRCVINGKLISKKLVFMQ